MTLSSDDGLDICTALEEQEFLKRERETTSDYSQVRKRREVPKEIYPPNEEINLQNGRRGQFNILNVVSMLTELR